MEVPNVPENMNNCICGTCPTMIEGDSGFFCSLGKSDKITERKGCVCGSCALWEKFNMSGEGYYCFNGKAS